MSARAVEQQDAADEACVNDGASPLILVFDGQPRDRKCRSRGGAGVKMSRWAGPLRAIQRPIPTTIAVLLLSALSAWVVWRDANEEPYVAFSTIDFLVQVVLATTLFCTWTGLACLVLWGASRGLLSGAVWLALFLWAVVVCFFLWEIPVGYVRDISRQTSFEEQRGP